MLTPATEEEVWRSWLREPPKLPSQAAFPHAFLLGYSQWTARRHGWVVWRIWESIESLGGVEGRDRVPERKVGLLLPGGSRNLPF
jgi:hypothetical protein